MPWVSTKGYGYEWVEPAAPEISDDEVITCTIGALTGALAEALKVVTVVKPPFKVGDKIVINATVTGLDKRVVNIVLDNVPGDMSRSFTLPVASLALAYSPAPYIAPDTDAA